MNWQDEQKKVATGVTGKREWVGLTDKETTELIGNVADIGLANRIVKATEAKLKEKNSCNS